MVTKITFSVDRKSIRKNPAILSAVYSVESQDTSDSFFRPAAVMLHHMVTDGDLSNN